jgi:2-amino-4-hydroxy-6-hydroxymethyldihydropteridine diphosphokinase
MIPAMNQAVIGIGSNIDPHKNIEQSLQRISEQHTLLAQSAFVETTPVGYTDQANFINGAIVIETPMSQNDLCVWLHELEKELKRVRTANKYGPRTIDLDIVIWNGEVIDKDVYARDFLKQAVQEVFPFKGNQNHSK